MDDPLRSPNVILNEWIRARFVECFEALDPTNGNLVVHPTSDPDFGDYQCDAAMKLAKVLHMSPRDIASTVAQAENKPQCVERIEVAGPGFINIHVSTDWLGRHLTSMQNNEGLGLPQVGLGSTVVIDYSSPNVAKPMHIGHIRSTVIGNALDRMHRSLGYRVIADNHLGDWGTQFGHLLAGYREYADPQSMSNSPIEELERIYRTSYERAKEDETWLNTVRAELVKLQKGDDENLRLWHEFIEISKGEFSRVYDRLDVEFDLERGESFYNEKLPQVIDKLETLDLCEISEGALVVRLDEEKLPLSIVRKTDGGYNYTTTDLATIWVRMEEFQPDKIIYVTDERQQMHFRQLFAIAARLGWKTPLEHVWFGLMRLPEGTFSTRDGNVIKLDLLLDEAVKRALKIVHKSSPDMPEDQQQRVAEAVGLGAIKYTDLSQNPQSLVTFTWEKALSMEGNSAPYLQYAHARIASVKDKYRERFPGADYMAHPIVLGVPLERKLGSLLSQFGDALVSATQACRPNYLADYLYQLAQTYSSFYQNVPFLKAEEGVRESRVRLCDLTARTLGKGLNLLGIRAPERI